MVIHPKKEFPRCYRDGNEPLYLCETIGLKIKKFYEKEMQISYEQELKAEHLSVLSNKLELPAIILLEAIRQNILSKFEV